MTGALEQAREAAEWARDLLESDRRYFEADAEIIPIPGAVIARLTGAETLGAGCVVLRIDAGRVAADADPWLSDVEVRLRQLGARRARLYLEAPQNSLDSALRRRGYRSRTEYGLARPAGSAGEDLGVELVPAEDEAGWSSRLDLMRRIEHFPDGHAGEAEAWIAMERRKHRSGYLRPYLIQAGGNVVGAVAAAACGSILRMKNLVVDPAHRRRGIASATAVVFADLAARQGFAAAGCFALEGEPGVVLYPRAGYREVARQTEWVRMFDTGELR